MNGPLGRWLKIPTLPERLRAQGVREDLVLAADRTAFGRQTDAGIPDAGALLGADEAVLALVEGRYAGAMGLLLLTSRRLVFAPAHADRKTPTTVPLSQIQSVTARIHRGLGALDVTAGGAPTGNEDDKSPGGIVVDQILGNQAESLVATIELAMTPPPDGPAGHRDPLEELAELRALHRAGAIGDTEFQIRKQQLFGQI